MAPIDYSRFDNIDTSSDTDDDDAEDANIEELLAEVEGGFSPEAVLDMASIIDSAVARTFGGDVDIMTDVLPPLHIRAGDSMFDGIAARIREYEDARPQRRRVALVANDVNDRFFPPILPKKKSKSHATPPGKQKQKQKKPRLPCVGCGAPARKKCSGCHKLGVDTRYCAASCQRDHWPKHKRECGTKHPEIVAKTASPIPGLPRDVVLTHILASPTCIADPGDLARLSAVSRAMRHAVRETKRPVYELSCVYFCICLFFVLTHVWAIQMTRTCFIYRCNAAAARGDVDGLRCAIESGAPMDGDTCEIASSWNALTCLTLLHARGCEMNHARCIIAAVRHGSRECVLWLKDFNGTRFDLKEMAAAAKAHIASPLRTLFERVNGIERRFGCFRSFLSDLVRDIARYGTDDERKEGVRYPWYCFPATEDEDEGEESDESEDEEDEVAARHPHLAGTPHLIPLSAGEFGAPPGYRAFAMRVGS